MKKILLVSRDPGGANTIIPLIRPLENHGFEVDLWGKDTALTKYVAAGLIGKDISQAAQPITELSMEKFLGQIRPQCIITGTSADDPTEKYIWASASKLNIPTFAILDQWVNYGIRFSRYGVAELAEYQKNPTHPYVPYRILVMDDYAKQEMEAIGLPGEKIVVTGQPYFQTMREYQSRWNSQPNASTILQKLGIPDHHRLIVFASEPIIKTYHESNTTTHYWGYTEHTIFHALHQALQRMLAKAQQPISLLIKLHPKEDRAMYQSILADLKPIAGLQIELDQTMPPWDLILSSHLVCGMSSMFLLEAWIFQKPVLSIQIGLCRENPLILSRRKILDTILDMETLQQKLEQTILQPPVSQSPLFQIISNPVERVIQVVESIVR